MDKGEKKTRREALKEVRNFLVYDEALSKLNEIGIADEFLASVENNKELREAISKIAPSIGPISADWSCCVTVSSPLRRPGEAVINPILGQKLGK